VNFGPVTLELTELICERHGQKTGVFSRISQDILEVHHETNNFVNNLFIVLPNAKKCSKNQFLTNPRWRTAPILKIDTLRYLRSRLANFEEILHSGTY